MASNLYNESIQIIKANQAQTGAYVASPNFSNYQYCWLRDGSFIAHAMDLAGEYDSARAFYRWVGKVIKRYAHKVDNLEKNLLKGLPIGNDSYLHTRYSISGQEEAEENNWGNFQVDGYGSWLWALQNHVRITGDFLLMNELKEEIYTNLRYLRLAWKLPSYDCWEENPEYLNSYSLGAIHAGFASIEKMSTMGLKGINQDRVRIDSQEVKGFLLRYGIHDGRLVKLIWPRRPGEEPGPVIESGVDASLMALAIPFEVVSIKAPVFITTINAIESTLHIPDGGVYRYELDTYYGGGEWLLLTAWLGWYYSRSGQISKAEKLRSWIEEKADSQGNLPEQINDHLLAPECYPYWLTRWGPVASPLLWSHAMYIILEKELS